MQFTTNAGGLLVFIALSVSWWMSKRIFISISNFKIKRYLFYSYQPNQDTNGNYYNIGQYDENDEQDKRYDGQD